MKRFLSAHAGALIAVVAAVAACSALCRQVRAEGAAPDAARAVLKLDPGLDALVSPNAVLETVKTGFGFTEGVTWVQKGGYILLSDIPTNAIYKLTPKGDASVYLEHAGYSGEDVWRVGRVQSNGPDPKAPDYEQFALVGSNGLTLDKQGRLVI